jgi:dipeptidyl aminopeptidase/acylaminoacyl peptidase
MGERPPVWDGPAAVLVSHEDRGRVTLVRLAGDGDRPPEVVAGGDRWIAGFDAAAGVVATLVTTPTEPVELEVGGRRSTFTAGFVSAVPARPAHRFAVASPAGDGDLDAWLVTPDGFDPDADPEGAGPRWPLLLSVHGGPMTQYGDRWFDEFQLLAGAGFVVVATNPHGSSGREDAFQRAIRSPRAVVEPGTGWGGIDADDLLAVLDATLARWPSLDPARVGVLGGSYGGFMASWLLGRTDRFAAGCSERAVNNLLSEEWSSDLAGTFHWELGVSHLEDPGEYLRMSPATYAPGITSPILLLHSEQDLRCPPEQADALFVALRLLGHPDVDYWRFPGEGHELSRSGSPRHRIHRAELINAFFRRTLGPGPR